MKSTLSLAAVRHDARYEPSMGGYFPYRKVLLRL